MVQVQPIRTEDEYKQALKELSRVFHSKEWSQDYEIFEVLSVLVEDYEEKHYSMDIPDPIEAIKYRMEQEWLSQKDLAKIIWYSSRVSEVLNRKRKLTLGMIRKLSVSLNLSVNTLVQDYKLVK